MKGIDHTSEIQLIKLFTSRKFQHVVAVVLQELEVFFL